MDAPPGEGYIPVVERYALRYARLLMTLQPRRLMIGFAALTRGLPVLAACAVLVSGHALRAEEHPLASARQYGAGSSATDSGAARASGWQIDQPAVWRLRLQSNAFAPDPPHDAAGHPSSLTAAPRTSEFGSLDSLRFVEPHGDVSGSVSYLQPLGADEREAVGINLQLATEGVDAYDRLLLQPSFEYQTPISGPWQLNARVFSTYAADGLSAGGLGTDRRDSVRAAGDGSTSQSGFRDVGVGVGVGYSLSQDWNIKTQAGIARQLRSGKTESTSDKDAQNNAYFGGVMLDYRF